LVVGVVSVDLVESIVDVVVIVVVVAKQVCGGSELSVITPIAFQQGS